MEQSALTFLVVDDFAFMRSIIKKHLKAIGHEDVIDAADGEMALEILKKQKIDFVLSDWSMPRMSGLALLKAIRADEALRRIPFVMVTAEGQEHHKLEAIRERANGYLIKPFTQEQLHDAVQRVMRR